MIERFPWLGNLHHVLSGPWAGVVLVVVAILCGIIIGAERESRNKAAGLRTIMLIAVGSCIYTLSSILLGTDPSRVAAQVVTGVGFLGAGAIIRTRGHIVGLTTGATIWTVAAIGVMVGAGFAAAGLVLTVFVLVMMLVVGAVERRMRGTCTKSRVRVRFRPDSGKTRVRLLEVLDTYKIDDDAWTIIPGTDSECIEIDYCHFHPEHRALLFGLAEVPGVDDIQRERARRTTITADAITF